jgi:glycosyltransferase involved in cell wall biosynthesis
MSREISTGPAFPTIRVLYVIDSLIGGGAETSLVDLSTHLQERGIALDVATLRPDDGLLEKKLLIGGVPVHRLDGCSYSPVGVARLKSLIRRLRPDLLHTTLTQSDITGRLAALGLGVPVVTSLVNDDYGPEHRANSSFPSFVVRGLQYVDRATARRTVRFHAITKDVAEVMAARLSLDPGRIDVISRARSIERLGVWSLARRQQVRRRLGLDDGVPVVLACGRLDRQKALDVVVVAFAEVRKFRPTARLIICGRSGNAAVDLEGTLALHGSAGVSLLGHRNDVSDLMCAADVLAFPSRWEGLGGTVIEAMALRLPVVVSDIGPLRETVGNTAAGIVAVDDAPSLAASIGLVDAAFQRFQARHTTAVIADETAEWYRRALAGASVSLSELKVSAA